MMGSISLRARGEEDTEVDEHATSIELGAAVERSITQKTLASGVTVAANLTAIEDLLEIEVGATWLNSSGHTEFDGDVLLKKPFRLSSTTELEIGLGPQVGRILRGNDRGNSVGMDFAVELESWPTKSIGWFVGPDYGYGIGKNRGERSVGVSGGILVTW
jgi:hypothetical protein